jgi:predicted secreted hydrolase
LIWSSIQAATTSVIADAGAVVVGDVAHVDIADVVIDAGDGTVVIKGAAVPIAALVAIAKIAVTVIDAAVKADVWAPISTVP